LRQRRIGGRRLNRKRFRLPGKFFPYAIFMIQHGPLAQPRLILQRLMDRRLQRA